MPLALLGLVAAVAVLFLLVLGRGADVLPAPGGGAEWLTQELGAPRASAPLERTATKGVVVEIGGDGYEIRRGDARVELATTAAGAMTDWRRHANGVTRATGFGRETITIGPDRTELYLIVDERQGARVWSWELETNLYPRLRVDGSVELAGGTAPMAIAPVRIYDAARKDVTPAGARWGLRRDGDGWQLILALDDSKLPLPYVIDPATDYPATQYMSRTASTTLTTVIAWQLVGTAPTTVCTAGTNCPGLSMARNLASPLFYQVVPGTIASSVRTTTASTTPDGKGWIVDAGGTASPGDTIIPAGDWTFQAVTDASAANASGMTRLAVGLWKVTIAGGAITASTMLVDPNSAAAEAAGASVLSTVNTVTTTHNVAGLPEIALAPDEHILVQLYAKQSVTHTNSNTVLRFLVGDANAFVSHPAATTRPAVPALVAPANAAWVQSTTPTLSATFSDADTTGTPDTGKVNFEVCSTADCSTVLSSFSSAAGIAIGANGQAAVPAAVLTNGSTYHWRAQNEDNHGIKSAFSATRSFSVDTTAPALPTYSLAESPASANQHVSADGQTFYYKPGGAGGTFKATASSSDPQSGINSLNFSSISGLTCANPNPCDSDFTPPYEQDYTWSAGTTTTGAEKLATATNNAGNTTDFVNMTFAPDSAAPTAFSLSAPAGGVSIKNGQAVSVAAGSPTDALSGMQNVVFKACAGTGACTFDTATITIGTDTTDQYSVVWSGQPADGTYKIVARASDNVGNTTDSPTVTVTVDNTGPAGVALATPTAGANIKNGQVVSIAAGNPTDVGSGVQGLVFKACAGTGACTFDTATITIGSDTTDPYSVAWSGQPADGPYKIVARATDNLGNTTDSAPVSVTIDNDPPSAQTFTVTPVSGSTPYVSGTTLFYRGASAGTFKLNSTVTDSGSGPASVTYPALAQTGWTSRSAETITTQTAGAYQSSNFSWSASSAGFGQAIVAADQSGNELTTTLTFTDDSTVPNNDGSVAFTGLAGTGSAYSTSTTLTLTFAKGTDAGAGMATTGNVLRRAEATLSSSDGTANGACGGFGAFATIATDPASPYTDNAAGGIQTGKCYRYEYVVTDNVGNTRTYTSADVKVVTTNPATPAFTIAETTGAAAQHVSGSEIFYNPSGSNAGSFTVDATATDAVAGVERVSFPGLGSGFTGGGDDTTPSPYRGSYSWDATATTAPGASTVTSTSHSTRTATGTFTVTKDAIVPNNDGSVAFTGLAGTGSAYSTSTTLSLTLATGTDAGSGIATTGNVLRRAEATLSSSDGIADGACGGFGAFATVATDPASPYTDDAAGGIEAGKCYRYEYVVTDNVGNTRTYTSADVKVDTTNPGTPVITIAEASGAAFQHVVGTETFYNPNGSNSGSFTVDATTSDAESGIEKVGFPALGAGFTGGGDDTTPSPFRGSYSWDATATTAPGASTVTATSNSSRTSTASFTVTKDATAPTGQALALTSPPASGYYTSASIALTPTDGVDTGGSGVDAATRVYERQEAALAGGTCASFPALTDPWTVVSNPDTTVVTGKCYRYRLKVSDNVGNQSAASAPTATAKVDLTDPDAPGLVVAEAPGSDFQHVSGTTLFYNPQGGNSGSFTVTATTADAEAGIEKVTFPALAGMTGGGDVAAPGPFQTTYGWTASSTAGGAQTVTAVAASQRTAGTAFTVTSDAGKPTGGSVGYFNGVTGVATASVSWNAGTDASGIATVLLQRAFAPITGTTCGSFGAYTTIATNPGASPYSDALGGSGCYRYQLVVTDNVGNTETFTGAATYRLSPPGPLTVTEGANAAGQALVGSVLFVNAAGGDFQIRLTDDGAAGIESASFPALAGNLSGAARLDDNGTDGFTSSTYTWNAAFSGSATINVTLTATGDGTSTETLTVTLDNTGPSGAAPTYAGGFQTSASTSVSFAGADAGAGIDPAQTVLRRRVGLWSGGACGAPGAFAQIGSTGLTSPFADTLPLDGCYEYQVTFADKVGNQATFDGASVYKLDATAPTVPISVTETARPDLQHFESATRVYTYNPSDTGSFSFTAGADAGSGVASVAYPTISGVTGFSGSNPYTFTTANSSAPPAQTITVTDNAGNSASATVSFVIDIASPTGVAIGALPSVIANGQVLTATADDPSGATVEFRYCPGATCSFASGTSIGSDASSPYSVTWSGQPADGTYTIVARATDNMGNPPVDAAPVTVTIDNDPPTSATLSALPATIKNGQVLSGSGTDAGSGVASISYYYCDASASPACTPSTLIGSSTTGPSYSVTWSSQPADGPYRVLARVADGPGNTRDSAIQSVTIDNVAATPSISSGPANPTTATSASFSFSASEGGTFECKLDGGAFASCTSPKSYTGLADGSHTFRVKLTDAAGNVSAEAVHTWTIDTVAPTVTLSSAPDALSGDSAASFAFSASEGSVTFQCRLDAGAFAACTSPKDYTGLGDGSHTFRVKATDAVGNAGGETTYTWEIDTNAPNTTLTSTPPATTTSRSASFAFTANISGSTFQCKLDGAAFAACTSPKSYTALADGTHTFQVRGLGLSGVADPTPATYTWVVDATPPALAASTPEDGSTIEALTSGVSLTASEPVTWSDVKITREGGAATTFPGATGTASLSLGFTATEQGLYTVEATIADGINAPVKVVSHFTIWVAGTGTPRPVEATGLANEDGSLEGWDGTFAMSWPAAAVSDALVIRMAPSDANPAAVTSFLLMSQVVDVTARLLLAGTPVTEFPAPLELRFRNAAANTIPAVSQDGVSWRMLAELDSTELPEGQRDGFYRDGEDLVVLTLHLTLFALLGDETPPTAPESLTGVVAADGLTLRWEPATDNTFVAGYQLLEDGLPTESLGEVQYEVKLGAFGVDDTRVFTVRARDVAGLYGPVSNAVTGVPLVTGATLEAAEATIEARGFTVGSVSQVQSSIPAGLVAQQDPAAPGVAPVGSAIDLAVSSGLAPRGRLVLGVQSSRRLVLKRRNDFIPLRVKLSAASDVTAVLKDARGQRIFRWRLQLRSGASILRLKLPAVVKRSGRYTIELYATGNGQRVGRRVQIRLVRDTKRNLGPVFRPGENPIDVVLVNSSKVRKDIALGLDGPVRVRSTRAGEAAFQLAAGPANSVGAIVVDVPSMGVQFIRDFHLVFPEVRIVALAGSPRSAVQASRAGAAVVLLKPVPDKVLAAAVRRALGRR